MIVWNKQSMLNESNFMYENFYTKKYYEISLQYVQEDSFSKKKSDLFLQ